MGNFRLSSATQNALANQLTAQTDAVGAGTIKLYDGTQPANANAGIGAQNLLATVAFGVPSFGTASSGTVSANALLPQLAAKTGTCTWARIADAQGYTVADCDCGVAGSGATLILNSTAVVQNGPVLIQSFTISVPSGT